MDEKRTDTQDTPQQFTIQKRKNYAGVYQLKDIAIPCYTKRQMKSLYPNGEFETVGESAPGTQGTGRILKFEDWELPLSEIGTGSRFIFKKKGYAAVEPGQDRFAVLLHKAIYLRSAVLGLILLVLIAGIVFFTQKSSDVIIPADISVPAGVPELESGAVDWEGIKVSEPENVPEDGIRIPGYKSITIQADTTEVSVNFQNPEKNNCYFVIRLVLPDTGETLYESKMIEPGKGLYNITLSRALEAGSYNAQLQYDPYDMTTLTRLNGAVINLELIAE